MKVDLLGMLDGTSRWRKVGLVACDHADEILDWKCGLVAGCLRAQQSLSEHELVS